VERDIDPDLIDGVPMPFGSCEPRIKPLAVYMRRLTGNGTLIEDEDEPVPLPKRSGGARHAIGAAMA
jgi:hypothetical protein